MDRAGDLVYVEEREMIARIGAEFYSRGWSRGTSSNYSVVTRREPLELLITASGADKGALGDRGFVVVDGAGERVHEGDPRPSAETLIHTVLARSSEVGAVLHTHSPWATILSDAYAPAGGFAIQGYEMLKGLSGVSTHEHREWIEVFENSQDMCEFSIRIERWLETSSSHAFSMRRHGLYTWGRDLDEARRHIEIFEFLFEVLGLRLAAGLD